MLTTPTTRPIYDHVEYLYECYLADPNDFHGKSRLLRACDHMGLLEDRDRILWENGMLHSDEEIEAAAATVKGWLDDSANKPEEMPVEDAIPTLDDLPELTPEQEAEALADAEVLARRLATDEPIAPHTPGQQMHYLVETAPWGPRPETPTHRIGGVTVSIG